MKFERGDSAPKRFSLPYSTQWLWALFDGVLIFLALTFLTKLITIQLSEAPFGIVSPITRAEIDPNTNYVRFIIIAMGTFLVTALSHARGASIFMPSVMVKSLQKSVDQVVVKRSILWAVLSVVLAIVLINKTEIDLSNSVERLYSFGQALAFLPAALSDDNPFESTFLIHGFGRDVLPVFFADYLATNDNRIALTILGKNLLQQLAYLGALLTIVTAIQSKYRIAALCITILVFCGAEGYSDLYGYRNIFTINDRDAVFLFQLPLLFGFLNAIRADKFRQARVWALLVGMSLPLSFLFIYDRALYMVMIVIALTIPIIVLGWKVAFIWCAGNVIGLILGACAVVSVAGVGGSEQIISQIGYWADYGRLIYAKPLLDGRLSDMPMILLSFGGAILIQCGTVLLLWREYREEGDLRAALIPNMNIITLLIAAVVFMNIALNRSDYGHVALAAMPSGLLAVVLLTKALEYCMASDEGKNRVAWLIDNRYSWKLIAILAVFGLSNFSGGGMHAAKTLNHYVKNYDTPDHFYLPADFMEAEETLRQQVQQSSCFFTMTSIGVWYYLFDRPSCSRHHLLQYVGPRSSQQEIVDALERKKPEIILFYSMTHRGGKGFDPFSAKPLVTRYIMKEYEPYKWVGSHWFWARSGTPVDFTDETAGFIDNLPSMITDTYDLDVSGVLKKVPNNLETATVFITHGEKNALIWAKPAVTLGDGGAKWAAQIPTAALSKGRNTLRFWLMEDKKKLLYPLSGNVPLEVN